MGPNPVSSSGKAVYEDEMGLAEGSVTGGYALNDGPLHFRDDLLLESHLDEHADEHGEKGEL